MCIQSASMRFSFSLSTLLSFLSRTRRIESQMERLVEHDHDETHHPRSHSRVSDVRTCVHTSCTRRMLNEPVSSESCRFSRQAAAFVFLAGKEATQTARTCASPIRNVDYGEILISIGELIWCLVGNCARGIVTVFNSIIGCLPSFHARIRIP